jgi:hypothetical protein
MAENYCIYAKYKREGLDKYLICSKSSNYCKYQRLCPTKKEVVHTDNYKDCSILRAEEVNMAKTIKKNDIVEKKEVEVNEDSAIELEKETKKESGIIILATANYYIVDVKGQNIKITKTNNYSKGDIVEL